MFPRSTLSTLSYLKSLKQWCLSCLNLDYHVCCSLTDLIYNMLIFKTCYVHRTPNVSWRTPALFKLPYLKDQQSLAILDCFLCFSLSVFWQTPKRHCFSSVQWVVIIFLLFSWRSNRLKSNLNIECGGDWFQIKRTWRIFSKHTLAIILLSMQ